MRKIMALVIAVSIVIGMLGLAVFADEADPSNPGLTVTSEPGRLKIVLEGEFGEKDWVGVYKNGETTDPDNGGIASLVWWYAGTAGSTVELPAESENVIYNRPDEFIIDGVIVPGDYAVMVLADDGYVLKEGYTPYYITVESTVVEGEDTDKTPSELLFFSDDSYGDLFIGTNDIDDFDYDVEKKCFVADVRESNDPYIELGISPMMATGGMAQLTAADALVISIGVRFDPTAANELEFYYQTEDFPGLAETQKVITDYSNTDGYQFVNIDLRQAPNWSGTLLNCRYDVFRSSKKACSLEIYYIGFFKSMAGANEFGEAWLAKGGGANDPSVTEAPETTDAPEVTAAPDDPTAPPEEEPTEEIPVATPDTPDTPEETGSPAKKGCGGVVPGISMLPAILGAALLIRRKKK